ncbi:hypothetical protein GCM10022228_14090 [Halomonas cibimaris]|uniref:DUF306 domain-containing protein n=2 Tax=Halomonas cibimaris TaxID=657012 RepID=A0ABP7LSA6_9GAMM
MLLGLALALTGCASSHTGEQPAADKTPDVALTDTYWKLAALENGPPVTAQDNQREAHFVLHSEGQRVAGATGCNQLMGNYSLSEKRQLRFAQLATTMMACPDSQGVERAFLDALNQASGWDISGKTLTLTGANDATLARFKAVHLY